MNLEQASKLPSIVPFKVQQSERKGRPLRIKASFDKYLHKEFEFSLFVGYIEHLVEKMLPPEILKNYREADSLATLRKFFQRFNETLPLIHYSFSEQIPSLLYFNTLCSGSFTHGVSRFLSDLISSWLIPGKPLTICSTPSLSFYFVDHDRSPYFMHQIILEIPDEGDLLIVKKNLPLIAKEAKQTILAVKHARAIISLKHLTSTQKASVIQENLFSLLDSPSEELDRSIFDHMHHFLMKASAEEKIRQSSELMKPLMRQRPDIFEADIFQEIKHGVLLFPDRFTSIRDSRHLTRLITFQYLFRKAIKAEKSKELLFKFLKTKLHLPTGPRHVLGVVVGADISRENETFEQKHVYQALQRCLPSICSVKDSYVSDTRDPTTMRLFYLEIEKESGAPFTLAEIKELRRQLPRRII
jgi:hypothetical protein